VQHVFAFLQENSGHVKVYRQQGRPPARRVRPQWRVSRTEPGCGEPSRSLPTSPELSRPPDVAAKRDGNGRQLTLLRCHRDGRVEEKGNSSLLMAEAV